MSVIEDCTVFLGIPTSPCLDHLVDLVSSIHGAEIEELDGWSCFGKFWRIVRWRSKLLEDLPAHACCRLLHLHHGAVSKITLNEEDQLVVLHQDIAAANIVEPSLHKGFDSCLIIVCSGTSRGHRRGDSRYKGFGIGRYQMFGELHEFRM